MMAAPAPIFRGRHGDYVAAQLMRESRRARILRCTHRRTGDEVVVKVARRSSVFDRPESAFHDSFAELFGAGAAHCLVEHEAFALQHLDDARVVRLLDYGLFDELRFIVIEHVPGRAVRAYAGEPWPATAVKTFAIELLSALEHLRERHVVHRDVRPENIIIPSVSSPEVTLIDFELAAVENHCVPGRVGDSRYRAPERYAAVHPNNDHRGDLYAAGAILYELCVGHPVFPAGPTCRLDHAVRPVPDLETSCPEVPDDVRHVIHRLLSKRPADRFQSAREALDALAGAAAPTASARTRKPSPSGADDAAALARLARLHRRYGLFEDAIDTATEACAHDPNDAAARATLASLLATLGAFDDAEVLARHAAELSNGSAAALVALALANLGLGRIDRAVTAVGDLLDAEEGVPEPEELRALAFALLDNGRPGDAVSVALYARQRHDSGDADSVLSEVAGTVAAAWSGETGEAGILEPLAVACTQLALAARCRGDDASRDFERAVEAGRALMLEHPERCSPEVVLHVAIAEHEVGNEELAKRLRHAVSLSPLHAASEAEVAVNAGLPESHATAVVVALRSAGQTRRAAAFVRLLGNGAVTPAELARLERLVTLDAVATWQPA